MRQQNLEVPGGRLDQGTRELVVRTLGRMRDVKDFNDLIVANFGGQPIYLKDVATVSDSRGGAALALALQRQELRDAGRAQAVRQQHREADRRRESSAWRS